MASRAFCYKAGGSGDLTDGGLQPARLRCGMSKIVVPIGADHRGYALKGQLIRWLQQNGYAPEDLGAHGAERRDALTDLGGL